MSVSDPRENHKNFEKLFNAGDVDGLLDCYEDGAVYVPVAGQTLVGREAEVPRNALAQDLVYETADGWMTAGAVSDSEWQGLARALGHPEWLDDERFKTPAGRVAYAKERLDQTAEVLKTRPTAGDTPSRSKRLAETRAACWRMG